MNTALTMDSIEAALAALVAVDTTSRQPNLAALALIEAHLDAHGVAHERVLDPAGDRGGLLARIGPDVPGGVVLSGHLDCVPVTGQPWTVDPFTLVRDTDRYLGRGTTDMKGFIAVVLAAVPRMLAADLQRPILLAFSHDEEVGTVGAPALVARLLDTQPRPAAVLVGEPTELQVVTAHKGVRSIRTVVEGRDGHSSQPERAANAVAAAARIAAIIDEVAREHRAAAADPRFDPPYTTFNLATITGGQAINIVPRRCELTWEYRPVPADDSDAILAHVQARADAEVLPLLTADTGEGAIRFEVDTVTRTLTADGGGAAEALARELGATGPAGTVPYGTDAGHFQAAGLSTVVWGPGSITQAHQPDEWIAVDQLEACDRGLDRLIATLAR